MTVPGWLDATHHGRRLLWRAPRLPRAHLSPAQVAAVRRGVIVALCALLAGALSTRLRVPVQENLAPAPAREAARA